MNNKSAAQPALIIKLKTLLPTVSKSEQQVLNFICQNPDKIIYFSVSELAESCQISLTLHIVSFIRETIDVICYLCYDKRKILIDADCENS